MAPIDDVPAAALGEFGGLAAGGRHTCVPRINLSTGASTILCWGADLQGQQGNGGAIPGPNNLVPATVSNSGAFERLAAGLNFMCALPRGGGTPSCWGENNHGQLGNGTLINASTPTPVLMPPKTTFTAIAAGDDHVCGLAASKLVYCWGGNAYGQVGNSSNVDQRTPVPVHGARLWATISLGGASPAG